MGLVDEMGPIDQSYQMQLYHYLARSSPEIVFFPDGSGTAIRLSKLVKDLGVQTENMCCPSAQDTEAASKARRLIYMIRRPFQDLSKSVSSLYTGVAYFLGLSIIINLVS